jgi:sulfite oxidase
VLRAGGAAILAAGCGLERARGEPGERAALAKRLITRLDEPYCAEAELDRLTREWITPVDDFFVVQHGRAPAIDAETWALDVAGAVAQPLRLGLAALRAMPAVTLPATLMCAGNRRREHHAIKKIDDPLLWGAGAIGNAWWTGVRLADVLVRAGVAPGARHVWFEGLDEGRDGAFGGSIPIERVMDRSAPPVVLAYRMNGAELPEVHGFPLRAVVPGYIGARSVKWLGRIVVDRRTSPNPYFTRDHRLGDRPIYELATSAAICRPASGARARGEVAIAGYAVAARPAATVARVEVSIDDGTSWQPAVMDRHTAPACWRRWWAGLEVRGPMRVVARAIDSDGRVQPRRARWNPGGYLYDGWSAIEIA